MLTTPGEAQFSALIDEVDGRPTVLCRGEIDLSTAGALIWAIRQVTAAGQPVRIDLAATTFMDSAGLKALLQAQTDQHRAGEVVTLSAPSPAVRRVLEMAGVIDDFAIEA
ncbi:MAG TPA: STAS domain-containing protein [Acidimicrobiales bacterium]